MRRLLLLATAFAAGGFLFGITSGYGLPRSLLWALGLGAIGSGTLWAAGVGRDRSGGDTDNK